MNTFPFIENRSILTRTSGFLGEGYTHSLNAYAGCGFSGSLCGSYCYAQHNHWITQGRSWGFYGIKQDIRTAYRRDYDRIKRPQRSQPKSLMIYMSSSTDPYCPQEQRAQVTRALLEEMVIRPPDAIVIQTHGTLITRDIDLIAELAKQSKLWVSLTVETDREQIPGFPAQASSPAKRMEVLAKFRSQGVPTQATVSPLCPIENIQRFAESLERVCDRVILDHYLLGDGSHGLRTRRTSFPQLLAEASFGEWNTMEKFESVLSQFRLVLGEERVLVSAKGFNSI
ncbi:radical SAM family protein [Bythopirellula goksoeyrii]|uniref:Radical SAM core domain-containing protein n=1 Tax=Bythopirellula goksoeyrii TaxID=1400387 RepID=A0A5B9QDZ9_9BACT|nr:radical SAM protein [Bythopirellula goksoeyrii]QEG35845.1 hypothetical protein Pr1d_31510 [Bythopirellula goksoeyrii]